LVFAAAGCSQGQKAAATAKATEVIVDTPVTRQITDYEEFTGHVEAVDSIDIRARVTGYLDKVNFKEGEEVKAGDLLFEIDPRPYKAALDQAEAQIKLAEARLKDAIAEVKRAEPLLSRSAVPQSDFDKMIADRDAAAAQVEAAKATAETNRLNLDFCTVTARISGRISRRYIDPGNLVKADDTVLTRINAQDPVYAYFDVDERTLLKIRRLIREGKIVSARNAEVPVYLALSDEQGFEDESGTPRHPGVMNFTDNRVDPNTGTLQVRGLFPNPELAVLTPPSSGLAAENASTRVRLFSPGMFVRVRLRVGAPREALLIREQALGTDQGNKFVYVVSAVQEKDETVHRVVQRPVKVGSLQDGLRVIEQGLKPGEKIIISGLQRVRPGTKVEPKLADPAARAEAAGRSRVAVNTDAPAPSSGAR
jgi:RND family efflux transporter MFP subunit